MIVFNGCSFTKYAWPTWADMLCYGYDDRINLGNMGSGNERTFLTTYPYLNKISKTCIQWSQFSRFDYKKDSKWNIDGNITLNHLGNWPKVEWFFDIDHFKEKDSTIKCALIDLLNFYNIDHCFLDFDEIRKLAEDRTYTFSSNTNKHKNLKNYKDGHPDVFLGYELAHTVADKLKIKWHEKQVYKLLPRIDEQIKQIKKFDIHKVVSLPMY